MKDKAPYPKPEWWEYLLVLIGLLAIVGYVIRYAIA